MSQNWLLNAKTILTSYKNIDKESKQIISKTLNALFNSARGNVKINKPKIIKKATDI